MLRGKARQGTITRIALHCILYSLQAFCSLSLFPPQSRLLPPPSPLSSSMLAARDANRWVLALSPPAALHSPTYFTLSLASCCADALSLHRSTLGLAQRQQQQQQQQRQTGEANNVCASRSEDLQRGGRSASFLLPPSSSFHLPPSSSFFLLPPPIAPEDRSRTSVAADDV